MNRNNVYNEEFLLVKISQGDESSFNIFFERRKTQLFTYLYKITRSAEISEEIVLDIFMKSWLERKSIPQIRNFDAFFYRVARNKAIDFLRSLKKKRIYLQWDKQSRYEPLSAEEADGYLLYKNVRELIEEAMCQLSPQRQKVFCLHHEYGFSNDEIARNLQLSKNTVRNHLMASVEFIRKFVSGNLCVLLLIILIRK